MEEGDEAAARPAARMVIYRPLSRGHGLALRARHVLDGEGKVVQAFAAGAQEVRERARFTDRCEEFEQHAAGVKKRQPHVLLR